MSPHRAILLTGTTMLLGIAVLALPCQAQEMPDMPDDAFAEMPATALFREGDDPAWAANELDTTDWNEVRLTIPPARQGVAFDAPVGWYRITLPPMRYPRGGSLQVQFDGVGGAVEAFMNGSPLRARYGGVARVTHGVPGEHPVFPPPGAPAGFTIKGPHWKEKGNNTLCLRVTRAPRAGGIEEGVARLGFALWMSGIVHPENRRLVAWEYAALAACCLGMLTALFMAWGDRRDAWHVWNAVLFFAVALAVLFGGYSLFFDARLTHGLMRLGWGIAALIPVCLLLLGRSAASGPRPIFSRTTVGVIGAACVMAALLLMLARSVTTLAFAQWLTAVAFLLAAVCLAIACRSSTGQTEIGVGLFLAAAAVLSFAWALHVIAAQTGLPLFSRTTLHVTVTCHAIAFYVLLVVRLHILREASRRRLRRNLEAQEDERRRIAMDLHDGVGQSMQSLKLRLQMDAQKAGRVEECKSQIAAVDACIHELRNVAAHLRPVFLGRHALADALRALCEQYAAESGVKVQFETNVSRPVEARTEEHLFRILQEALTNASRHGHARQIEVSLRENAGRLSMIVRDDGGGAKATDSSSRGLFNMHERAQLLGGDLALAIRSDGAELRITVPFPATPAP
ncbi:MAG: histidine kinase [Prosthecobacter sp.]